MKRIMSIVLAALLVISMVPFAVLAEGDIEIATYADLVAWATNGSDDAGKTVRLTADIVANAGTAASFKTTAPENVWNGKNFAGTFDGQGHSISGLYNSGNGGLIRTLTGTLKNLYLLESCIMGGASSMGIVANGINGGTIENVYANGYLYCANHAGGIVGIQTGAATIRSCWFDGDIESNNGRYVAGIVGNQSSKALTVIDCLNTGSISTTNTTGDAAGISGGTYSGSINATRCVNTGLIVANAGVRPTGGIAQYFDDVATASFVDCYSIVGTANTADSVFLRNMRHLATSAKTVASVNDIPELAGWTHNIDGYLVPEYFANVEAKHFAVQKNAVEISTYAELVDWASKAQTDYKGMTAILTADIVANTGDPEDWLTTPPANVWTPILLQGADFDGQGHTISGLYIKTTAGTQGMFTKINYAEARNFKLVNSLLNSSNSHTGFVVGDLADYSRISDIYVEGLAVSTAASMGGVVGGLAGSTVCTVRNVWFNGEMRGAGYASGIVGNQESRNLITIDVLNTGKVSGGNINAGISGAVYTGSINALRTVNAGVVTSANGNDASAIVNTITSNTSKAGWATFTDTYTVKNTAAHANPMDVRFTCATKTDTAQTDNFYPVITGSVGEIDSLDDLQNVSAFSGWVKLANGLVVPGCFAGMNVAFTQETRDVIEIGTYDELVAWAASSNKAGVYVVLTADITANTGSAADWATAAPSKVWPRISGFSGVFDGQGHTISGIYSTTSGLFATAGASELLNFRLVNSYFNASGRCAAIVDNPGYTTIKNVYTDAIVETTGAAGSFTATQSGPLIMENCWANGIVKSTGSYVSGIVANQQSNYARYTDVLNTATVFGTANVGGISNAVYRGTFYGTRVVNGGKIYAGNFLSSGVVDIVSAVNAPGGVAEFVENYNVKGTADFVGVRDKRASGVTGSSVTGTVVEINSLADLASKSAFSGWATNPDGVKVPAGFGQYALNTYEYEPSTIEIGDYEALLAWAKSTTNAYDNVVLTADITVDADTYGAWATKNYFKGTFDGQGYSITGLTDRLVNNIANATIKDVSLVDSVVSGGTKGAFAGTAYGYNNFINCYTNATVSGASDNLGGFVGQLYPRLGTAGSGANAETTFTGCWFDGSVTITNRYASGFVGNNQSQNATFVDCLFTGSVEATAPGDTPIAAGFAGAAYNGVNSYTNCLYAGTLSFGGDWENNAGGALGLRAYKVSQETYVNNYALNNATFKYLMNESEGENPDTEGKITLVESTDLETLDSQLGSGWGTAKVGSLKMAVPAAFAQGFTYGDLDDSGVIDTVDLTLMRQYLTDSTTVVNLDAADTDGSGVVDTIDLTLLRQYLTDSTVVLGPTMA